MASPLRYAVWIVLAMLSVWPLTVRAGDLHSLPYGKLFDLGLEYTSRGNASDSAIMCYSIIDERYRNDASANGLTQRARALNNRGYVWYYGKFDFRNSIIDLMKSLELCERLPHKIPTEAYACLNIANIFTLYSEMKKSGKYRERAGSYLERGFKVARELKEWEIAMRTFVTLTTYYLESDDSKALLDVVRRFRESSVPGGVPLAAYCRARADALEALVAGDIPLACGLFKRQLRLIDTDITPERYRLQVLGDLSLCYSKAGMADSAGFYMSMIDNEVEAKGLADLRPISTGQSLALKSSIPPEKETLTSDSARFISQKNFILEEGGLDEISDIFLEREIEKAAHRESGLAADRSKGRKVILYVSSGLLLALAVILILMSVNRRLARRNRRLYEIAREKASESAVPFDGTSGGEEADTAGEPSESDVAVVENPSVGVAVAAKEKYASSSLSREELRSILAGVSEVLRTSQEIFTSEFSLSRLAELAGSRPRYVSEAISVEGGRSFNSMVNELRVLEACRRFDDTAGYGNMTVEAVGRSVGFRSRSSFSEAFKRYTGLTPSAYVKQAGKSPAS